MEVEQNQVHPDDNNITKTSAYRILTAVAFCAGINLRFFDALLPNIAHDFNIIPGLAAVVATAFTLSYGLFQIVLGPIGDRFGKLRIIAFSALIVAFTSLGAAFAPTLQILAFMRFLTGIGSAGIIPLTLAWLGDNSSFKNRQVVLGQFVGFLILGQIFGPVFSGFLSNYFGWNAVFLGISLFFMIVGMLLLLEVRKTAVSDSLKIKRDYIANSRKLLRDPRSRKILITAFIEGAVLYGLMAYAGAFLKTRFDLSYLLIGGLLACYGAGGFTYSRLVRLLLKNLNEKIFIKFAGALVCISFLILSWIPVWQMTPIVLFFAGFGFYMFHNTLQSRATEMSPLIRGTAVAFFAFSLFIGQSVGITFWGQILRYTSYRMVFIVGAVIILVLSRWFAAGQSIQSSK